MRVRRPRAARQPRRAAIPRVRHTSCAQVMDEEDRLNPSLLINEAKLVRGGAKPDRLEKLAKVSVPRHNMCMHMHMCTCTCPCMWQLV